MIYQTSDKIAVRDSRVNLFQPEENDEVFFFFFYNLHFKLGIILSFAGLGDFFLLS